MCSKMLYMSPLEARLTTIPLKLQIYVIETCNTGTDINFRGTGYSGWHGAQSILSSYNKERRLLSGTQFATPSILTVAC
jgi:hypothetical protein